MIKAIIFDLGGVLIKNPDLALTKYCSKKLKVNFKKFEKILKKYKPIFQKGKISEKLFLKKISKDLKIATPSFLLWSEAVKSTFSEKKEVWRFLKTLKKKYKIALLTNAEPPVEKFLNKEKKSLFDKIIFSFKEKKLKPEKEIYKIALKKLKVKPEEVVIIDDRKDFLEGAKRAGIKNAILFKNLKNLKKELSKIIKSNYDNSNFRRRNK
jgi:putative hydrolase of the HAD superfamily